jgi:arylformamidase
MSRLVDLSHTLESGMPVFPGDPEVSLVRSPQDDPWQVRSLSLGTHSGTHIDAARHFVSGGRAIDEYPLERFVLFAQVVPGLAGEDEEIDWPSLADRLLDSPPGGGVLFNTGWDTRWGDHDMAHHPFLSRAACEGLVERGFTLVGTDALNVDSTTAGSTHAHEVLLGHDVLVVENLTNLSRLNPGQIYQCAFVPLKLAASDGSPIRAYAWTP